MARSSGPVSTWRGLGVVADAVARCSGRVRREAGFRSCELSGVVAVDVGDEVGGVVGVDADVAVGANFGDDTGARHCKC